MYLPRRYVGVGSKDATSRMDPPGIFSKGEKEKLISSANRVTGREEKGREESVLHTPTGILIFDGMKYPHRYVQCRIPDLVDILLFVLLVITAQVSGWVRAEQTAGSGPRVTGALKSISFEA